MLFRAEKVRLMAVEHYEDNILKFPEPEDNDPHGPLKIRNIEELTDWIMNNAETLHIGFNDDGEMAIVSKGLTDIEINDRLIFALRYVHSALEEQLNDG